MQSSQTNLIAGKTYTTNFPESRLDGAGKPSGMKAVFSVTFNVDGTANLTIADVKVPSELPYKVSENLITVQGVDGKEIVFTILQNGDLIYEGQRLKQLDTKLQEHLEPQPAKAQKIAASQQMDDSGCALELDACEAELSELDDALRNKVLGTIATLSAEERRGKIAELSNWFKERDKKCVEVTEKQYEGQQIGANTITRIIIDCRAAAARKKTNELPD